MMAMSIVLPVLGLALFNRTTPQESTGVFSARLSCALGLIIGGFLSSAVGAFGVPALLVLALFKRLSIVRCGIVVSITSLGFGVPMMALLLTEPSGHFRNAQILRDIMTVLTALGAVLVGSPVGLTTFSFNWTAAMGLSICVVVVICMLAAWRRGLTGELALPLQYLRSDSYQLRRLRCCDPTSGIGTYRQLCLRSSEPMELR